ncbi:MAG: ATP F0F1 synthase subunit B [Rickettsiaceae bacterium]|nr:ATP F0F1 synthase subunit B [Rickettsiaceae bacterium]
MTHFLDENFVVAVCFVIFVYLSYRPIKKAIINSLDARINDIKTKLEETEKLKHDAKLLLEEVETEIKNFEKEKGTILRNAEQNTEKLIEIRAKEMGLFLEREKNSAIQSINNQSVKSATAMRVEFMNSVLSIVRSYLAETKNNSVSDEEIVAHFLKK